MDIGRCVSGFLIRGASIQSDHCANIKCAVCQMTIVYPAKVISSVTRTTLFFLGFFLQSLAVDVSSSRLRIAMFDCCCLQSREAPPLTRYTCLACLEEVRSHLQGVAYDICQI
jgi:hypothetical protein